MASIYQEEKLPQELREGWYAIGNFDGLHKGHQAIVKRLKILAGTDSKGVITFSPHPKRYFNPAKPHFYLYSRQEKYALLTSLGIDIIIDLPFTQSLAQMEAEQFIETILCDQLGVKGIIVGEGFRFGRGRLGSVETLKKAGKSWGFSVETIPLLFGTHSKQMYSSSYIRQFLYEGNPAQAAQILGRFFSYKGVVQKGRQIGRTLGFPTANIKIPIERMVKQGIYVVYVTLPDGSRYPSVGYVADEQEDSTEPGYGVFEAHLDNFDGDLYGHTITIELCDYIRQGRQFTSQDDLINRIQDDCNKMRAWFKK